MTQFTKDYQPKGRGRSERTKILSALKRKGINEDGFYDHLLARALDPDDTFALREILGRFSPLKKAVMPSIEFEFNKEGTPVDQVGQLLDAVSSGDIPPDVATMLIGAIKGAIEIEVNTELKDRIEQIEERLGVAT